MKRRILIATFFLFQTTALTAVAKDSCSEIPNIAKGLGAVYDQVDTSWCHSFTAADLLTQKLQRMKILKPGERIHPLAVGAILQLSQQRAPNFGAYNNGSTVLRNLASLEWAKKAGIKLCRENEMGSSDYYNNPVSRAAMDETMKTLRSHLEEKIQPSRTPRLCGPSNNYDDVVQATEEADSSVWIDELSQRCTINLPKLQIVSVSEPGWPMEIADGMNPTPNPRREKILGDAIDKALESGSLPALDYNPDFVVKENLRGGSTHWNSIIARKRGPDGQCQYLLRNSWGQSCSAINVSNVCEAGNIWVSRDRLLRSAKMVEYIR